MTPYGYKLSLPDVTGDVRAGDMRAPVSASCPFFQLLALTTATTSVSTGSPGGTAPREEGLCDPQPGCPSILQQSGDASAEGSAASNRCETRLFPPGSNKRANPPETALGFHPAQLEEAEGCKIENIVPFCLLRKPLRQGQRSLHLGKGREKKGEMWFFIWQVLLQPSGSLL